MIEGLKIEISSAELTDHISARAEFHEGKAAFYDEQVSALKAGGVGAIAQSNDPVSSLQGSARQHMERSAFFRFMAEHLIPDETYRLDESDLGRLEIVSRYYG
jgi:hypothetical protein